jgi:flavin-dependent dehydrogenase
MKHFQVIIIGGGPAGAACAGKLVQAGVDCLVLDKATFPRSKTCAGWITPEVFMILEQQPSDYPHSLTVFPKLRINIGRFPITRSGIQYAIRRIEFDDWLIKKAGAKMIQHDVKEIHQTSEGFQIDGQFTSKVVVGAGGSYCPVYHQFFKEDYPRNGSPIIALEEEFQHDWSDPTCRLWFFWNGLPGYAWYVPKMGGFINVGLGGNAGKINQQNVTIRDYWTRFVSFLVKRDLLSDREFHPRGHSYFLRGNNSVLRKDGLYLVGDSAGLATLDMGEGIGPAIQSGNLAAKSIIEGSDYVDLDISRYSLLPPALRWLLEVR